MYLPIKKWYMDMITTVVAGASSNSVQMNLLSIKSLHRLYYVYIYKYYMHIKCIIIIQ